MNSVITAGNWEILNQWIRSFEGKGIFILADSNTALHCFPVLKANCSFKEEPEIITVPAGDQNKSLESVAEIWRALMAGNARRNSLLICLGGGMITDLGSFAASAFKRGMSFILIPTTLLAMVDAAIGGKNGINFEGVKNQAGSIATGVNVFIFPEFLATLPEREMLSGKAEMLKHAIISSRQGLTPFVHQVLEHTGVPLEMIVESASLKNHTVESDPYEKGWRRVLNFGHTVGHALEAFSHRYDVSPVTHGEAVANGMICEAYLSWRVSGLSSAEFNALVAIIVNHFPVYRFSMKGINELLKLMLHDKKNSGSDEINFTLLKAIGQPVIDRIPGERLIREGLHFLLNLEPDAFRLHKADG